MKPTAPWRDNFSELATDRPWLISFSLAPNQLWQKISEKKLDLEMEARHYRRRWFSAVKAERSMVDLIPVR
jgi:hypothetical protein